MNRYNCDICHFEFKKKEGLTKHQNKKYKCNIITNFQCLKCKKYFRLNCSLKEHSLKNSCKEVIIDDNNIENNNRFIKRTRNELFPIFSSIIFSLININIKAEIIRQFSIKYNKEQILATLRSNLTQEMKIKTLLMKYYEN